MHTFPTLLLIGLAFTATEACSKAASPAAPTPVAPTPAPIATVPTPAPGTRIIRVGGDMNFGNLSLSSNANNPMKDGAVTVSNDGNDTLQITGMTGPCAGTYLTKLSATPFAVAPGETVSVGFRFAPRIRVDCSGTITVLGDQTSGSNTIAVTARGVLPGCEVIPDPLPPPCAPPTPGTAGLSD